MPAAKGDKIRQELASPARLAAAGGDTLTMTTQSAYQPRTANILGSRTSVSNPPPASKPPAGGHAGRGMK